MKIEKIMQIKKEYYTPLVLKKIIEQICFNNSNFKIYREFAILNYAKNGSKKIAFRGITFSNPYYLEKTLFNKTYSKLNFLNDDSNIYCSVARIKQIPFFSFDVMKRSKETKPFFEKEYIKYLYRYDIFMDFDIITSNDLILARKNKKELDFNKILSERLEDFLKEIEKIIKIIIQYRLKAEVVFSGYRGFKILIYNEEFSYNEICKIISRLPIKLGLKYLDNIASFLPSKLMKCNFTLTFKNDSCKIVLPLQEYNYNQYLKAILQFKNFDIFDYKLLKDKFEFDKLIPLYPNFFYKNYNHNNLKKFLIEYSVI